jgi:CRP/FNR family transcriptional regulator
MTKAKFSQIKKFFSKHQAKKIAKGTIIFKPGDKINDVYFINSGFVRIYTKTGDTENTLNIFKPLFLMSYIHHMTANHNNFYFEAITPLDVRISPEKDFNDFLAANPEFSALIMDFFLGSLLKYISNQGNIINGNAVTKIASILLQLTTEYGETKNGKLVVNFPATHRIIANIVGLTRETTSVQMSKLQKLGVISTKRTQFIVHDLGRLKILSELTDQG